MTNVYAGSPSGGAHEKKFKEWFDASGDPKIIWVNTAHGLLLRFDDHPVTEGHLLAVPWEAAQRVDDMDPRRHAKLARAAQFAGQHLETVALSEGKVPKYVGELVAGGQVWHAHRHRAICFEGRDWIGGFDGQPRLDLTEEAWADTIHRYGATFDGATLDAELDAMGPPEDLAVMERQALMLRDRRLALVAATAVQASDPTV